MSYTIYRLMTGLMYLFFFPVGNWLKTRRSKRFSGLEERLAVYGSAKIKKKGALPRIWIHAASVGETGVALNVVEALNERTFADLVVSTMTVSGLEMAGKRFGKTCSPILAPLDFPQTIRKALEAVSPDVFICLETEIWPNWLKLAQESGIRTALINGRISSRSFGKYRKIRSLIGYVFEGMDGFSMIGAEDARRAGVLGADAKKIAINGNAKYDGLHRRINWDEARKIRCMYTPGEKEIVWVAGSTRRFEETVMLNVYQQLTGRFPHLLLIIAPRHIERSDYITEQVHKRGLRCQRRSELNESGRKRDAPIVVVDIIGELFATYSVADLVFCGGSLAPLGGQNIMEPAIWGKPVFFGPSMDDFNDARMHLEDLGGGFMVKDEADLAETLYHFIVHPKLRKQAGDAAKAAANFHRGAAGRHAGFIQALIS